MPSPRGTNFERLFMPSRSPAGAYDAALESGAGATGNPIDDIKTFLKGKLSDADFAEVEKMLSEYHGLGMDDPADFPGKPRVGGSNVALDRLPPRLRRQVIDAISDQRSRNEAGFLARYPDAAKIGFAY
jgi:hypothetical protein